MEWKEILKDPEWFLITVLLSELDSLEVDRIIKDVRKQQEKQQQQNESDA